MYVLDLDPHYKMSHHTLYRVAAFLFCVWSGCFALTIAEMRLFYIFHHAPAYLVYSLSIFVFVYLCQCYKNWGYGVARFQVLTTIWQILKVTLTFSVSGRVDFRDFFFADIITSLVKTLQDAGSVMCYLTSNEMNRMDNNTEKESDALKVYFIVCGIVPFVFRFFQCINKFNYAKTPDGKKVLANLYNTLKYVSKMVPPVILIFYEGANKKSNAYFYVWFNFQVITTLYVTVWDFYMDWGLFETLRNNQR